MIYEYLQNKYINVDYHMRTLPYQKEHNIAQFYSENYMEQSVEHKNM